MSFPFSRSQFFIVCFFPNKQPETKRYHDKYLHGIPNLEPRSYAGKERDKAFGKSASLTSFPELLHVNFSVINGKSFWPCLFCAVVQLANLSMDHVIDALAANVIITSTQTINRAWNFDDLVNMVQESSAIDILKAFTQRDRDTKKQTVELLL